MLTNEKPRVVAAPVEQKPRIDELRGEATNGFGYVATSRGYTIYRNGIEVGVGVGTACVETNAQRAAQALTNRGVALV
jgi:hypothetical protein